MRIKRSKEEWIELIQKQKKSGKSIGVFCKEQGIHPTLFYRKIRTFKSNDSSTFVKVPITIHKDNRLTVNYGKVSIEISWPITKEELVLILISLKEAAYAELS